LFNLHGCIVNSRAMVAKNRVVKAQSRPVVKTGAAIKKANHKSSGVTKLRIGILVGKDFDPVKKGMHDPETPKKFLLTEEDWGKYSIDVQTALKMQRLHPDLLTVDIIPGKEINEKRLQQNHVNLNFWYDVGVAMMNGGKQHIDNVMKVHTNPDCRLDPSWDYYDWIVSKPRYLKQCEKAGIPIIPTLYYNDGFRPQQVLKDVQKKGWEKFFAKVGHFSFFGEGAIHGKTSDFLGVRMKDLEKYAKDNAKSNIFLVQPFMLKPNGEVFDEVRNFFIDGEWRYSVFTHGTDGSDAGYYMEPEGPRKDACKALAERVYQQVLKTASWQGMRQTPLLNRIDIGVIPSKGANSLHRTDNMYFMNEIECIMTTWLDRYSPVSVPDAMAQASVKHSLELLVGLLKSKRSVPDRAELKQTLTILNNRLGSLKRVKL